MNKKININNDSYIIYLNENEISSKVKELSQKLNEYYYDKNPIIIGVLKGSVFFMIDIIKNLKFKYEIDFIDVKSYIDTNNTNPKLKDISTVNVSNRNILIVEDIVDTGNTLSLLYQYYKNKNANDIKVISLLLKDKIANNDMKNNVDWHGFKIVDKYVIGYGLDINNLFRELKDIYIKDEKK